jgi:hydrogenase nickel incorporation protein HypB
MCDTCGCGEPDAVTIRKAGAGEPENKGYTHAHPHSHGDGHSHAHDHFHEGAHTHDAGGHDHDHAHGEGGRIISIEKDILSENNRMAERNRGYFEAKGVTCFNLVSSPGSGKTTLLEATVGALKDKHTIFIIEGDQQGMLDADRLAALGVPVVQINTGSGCHLDAEMVHRALNSFDFPAGSLLFIENVGNLVCPALFDLGESARVLIMSVTEGDDKPVKYPTMFRSSQLCLINKTDLLPYVDFDVEVAERHAGRLNPDLSFLRVSATTGDGLDQWFGWVTRQVQPV